MSLITQCPACATLFKVVPDQLRISEGWVRCGQCDEVFDANAQMVPEDMEPERREEDETSTDVVPAQEPDRELQPQSDGEHEEQASGIESPLEVDAPAMPDPILDKSPNELAHLLALPEGPLPVDDAADLPVNGVDQRIEPRLDHLLPDPPITFVPLRDPSGTVSRFSSSAVLGFFVGLLILALVLQWLVKERDRLAAMDVGLQPVLHAVCSVIGCEVGNLRQIDAIVIESSSFVKVRNDIFRLHFVLKSGAQVPLAMPAMELTLTDAQDQPVLRKVILASEFGVEGGTLAPGTEVAVSVPLSVKTASSGERVAGYRLLAFYP